MKVEIEKFDHQGRGITYVHNKVCFVRNTLPGEIVDIKITKDQKKYQEGEVRDFIHTSENRIEPVCPYFSICGGCDLMHLNYSDQLTYKENKIRDILNKYANVGSEKIKPIVDNDSPLNYRNKVTFQVKDKIGYFEKGSYELIAIDECKIVDARINEILTFLKQQDLSDLNQVVIRVSRSYPDLMVIFKGDKRPHISQYLKLITSCYFEGELLFGTKVIREKIGNLEFSISPDAFFQVNTEGAEKLYQLVRSYLTGNKNDRVLDLYCGTGTIGLFVSDLVSEVIGVEINKQAVIDAEENKKKNNLKNISFYCGDVAKMVSKLPLCNKVIVDPPRAGLDDVTLNYLLKNDFSKIIYVSCDPVTLARDLKKLSEKYEVVEITPVDLFSQTYHVECVTLLQMRGL